MTFKDAKKEHLLTQQHLNIAEKRIGRIRENNQKQWKKRKGSPNDGKVKESEKKKRKIENTNIIPSSAPSSSSTDLVSSNSYYLLNGCVNCVGWEQ